MLKIYLDDLRDAPEGWLCVRDPQQVIALLQTETVTDLSLDHDLGDDAAGTGYDVLLWLEEKVAAGELTPPRISIHSANVSARTKMELAVLSIQKLARDSGR